MTTPTSDNMPLRVDPARLATLTANLASIHSRITAANNNNTATSSSSSSSPPTAQTARRPPRPRLVAVSKLKPATDILGLATHTDKSTPPQRHFGENYVQELLEKSKILWNAGAEETTTTTTNNGTKVGRQIRWHFIGGLQSNKATQLARDVRGLWCVESVDSVKKARGLAKGWAERGWRRETETTQPQTTAGDAGPSGEENGAQKEEDLEEADDGAKLRVMIQVNTSGEDNKSGVEPNSEELVTLARCIREECAETLKLQGLMTIGAIARSQATKDGEENEDFVKLKEVRDWLVKELGLDNTGGDGGAEELELSMGMSEDFESAIRLGSSEVRIGSTIFGERPPKSEAKVL